MGNSELQVVAGIWRDIAVLVMEGEAADRTNGGGTAADALYRVTMARGLRLTTDVVHLDLRPVRGWRLVVDHADAITLTWPHRSPLLAAVPLDLPPGWRELAAERELVEVFAGYGLGMHEHAADGDAHPLRHLARAAESGAVAAGSVAALVTGVSPVPAPRVASSGTSSRWFRGADPRARTSNSPVLSDGLAGRQ